MNGNQMNLHQLNSTETLCQSTGTESFAKFTCEWDNYFNDGFDIFSINNGLDKRNLFTQFYQTGSQDKIELNIENGLEFSFKEDHVSRKMESQNNTEEKIDLIGIIDIRDSVDVSASKPETELNNDLDKEKDKEKENKAYAAQDKKPNENIREENEDMSGKLINPNKNEVNNNGNTYNINGADRLQIHIPNLYQNNSESIMQEKDPLIIEENFNNKASDLFINEDEEFYMSNPNNESNRNIINSLIGNMEMAYNIIPSGSIDHNKYDSNFNYGNDLSKLENIVNNINDVPGSHLADIEIIKSKEGEIKMLIDKLGAYKYQNKLITDENKKLLEVINIFQVLQSINKNESEPLSSTNQIVNNNPTLVEKKEENSKVEHSNPSTNSSKNIRAVQVQKTVKSKDNFRPQVEKNEKGTALISKKTYIQVGQIKTRSYGTIHMNKNVNKENFSIQKTNNYDSFEKNKEAAQRKLRKSPPDMNNMQMSTTPKVTVSTKPDESLGGNYKIEVKSGEGLNLDEHNNHLQKFECISPGLQYYSCEKKAVNIEEISINGKKKNNTDMEYRVVESKNGQSDEKIEKVMPNRDVMNMNNQRISSLNSKNLSQQASVNQNKKVESIDIQNYLITYQDQLHTNANNHIIPFYLIEKRKLYENIVHYTFEKSQKQQGFPYYKGIKRSKSNPRIMKNKILF